MPFFNGFPFGGSTRTQANSDPAATTGPSTHHDPRTHPAASYWSRVSGGLANETSGLNAGRLMGWVMRYMFDPRPSFMHFLGAMGGVYGSSSRSADAHPQPPSMRNNSAYLPIFSGDNIGARTQPIVESLERGIRSGLEHIFSHMDGEENTRQLRAFQLAQQAYLRNGMRGQRPEVPACVPEHLREFVALLDPADESFGHAIYEMVTKNSEFQQRVRDQMASNIGTAPQPRPGHYRHDHGGNDVLPPQSTDQNEDTQLDAQTEPLQGLQDDGASASPALGHTNAGQAPRRRPTSEDDAGAQSGAQSPPTPPANR